MEKNHSTNDDDAPKVFISYSWAVQSRVIELCERLASNGIHAICDVYDLKEGQDKHHYMEQSVNDKTICKVLMICDQTYAQKADSRENGVGEESMIISPKIYDDVKEDKFIPIVWERDENAQPYLPSFLASRIFIDLTEGNKDYERQYEKLIRLIYNKPELSRPKLGKRPAYLDTCVPSFHALKGAISQLQSPHNAGRGKQNSLMIRVIDQFITTADECLIKGEDDFCSVILDRIKWAADYRNYFVEFIVTLIENDSNIEDAFVRFAETFYNKQVARIPDHGYRYDPMDIYAWILKSISIAFTAVCLYYEKYSELHAVVSRHYFLRRKYQQRCEYEGFCTFRDPTNAITDALRNTEQGHLYHTLLTQYEYPPIITAQSLKKADLLLAFLGNLGILKSSYWYPETYPEYGYSYDCPDEILRLTSKKYCEKVLSLFGATSVQDLKHLISREKTRDQIPLISSYLNKELIAAID